MTGPGLPDTGDDTGPSPTTLSTGPLWRLVVAAAAPAWSAHVVGAGWARTAALAAGDGIEVAATPWGDRMDCAWALTGVVGELVATDPAAFAGVGLSVVLPGLTVLAPPEVLGGVLEGRGRRWWAAGVDLHLG